MLLLSFQPPLGKEQDLLLLLLWNALQSKCLSMIATTIRPVMSKIATMEMTLELDACHVSYLFTSVLGSTAKIQTLYSTIASSCFTKYLRGWHNGFHSLLEPTRAHW